MHAYYLGIIFTHSDPVWKVFSIGFIGRHPSPPPRSAGPVRAGGYSNASCIILNSVISSYFLYGNLTSGLTFTILELGGSFWIILFTCSSPYPYPIIQHTSDFWM